MKHVLVTGGAGFIGSHLVDAYLARGWRVSVIDNLSTGARSNIPAGAAFFEADIRDCGPIIRELRPDVISHHAAQVDVRKSVADPASDAHINVVGSLGVLEAAREAGASHFIFASSGGAIYGEPAFAPQTEAHPVRPLSPYGCAKLAVEHYLDYYREVLGLATSALRYANVYGERQNANGEAGVVAIFAGQLLSGTPVTINGDGTQSRDFVHVSDVVRANLLVTESGMTGAFNVGTGVETSINQLYALLAATIAPVALLQHGPPKVGEQKRSVLDGSRFAPYLPLPEGLRRTVDWFRARIPPASSGNAIG